MTTIDRLQKINIFGDKTKFKRWALKNSKFWKQWKLCFCDGRGFAASVLPTAAVQQMAATRQSESESECVQVPCDTHKSTFFRPEVAAPWLEQCKNTDHKAVVFGPGKYLLAFSFTGLAL
jgi:hypothetical protein